MKKPSKIAKLHLPKCNYELVWGFSEVFEVRNVGLLEAPIHLLTNKLVSLFKKKTLAGQFQLQTYTHRLFVRSKNIALIFLL